MRSTPDDDFYSLFNRKEPAREHLTNVTPLDPERATRYAAKALRSECENVAAAPEGERNHTLNRAAFSIGQLVAAGHLERDAAHIALFDAAQASGLRVNEIETTIGSGFTAGEKLPRVVADRPPLPDATPLSHLPVESVVSVVLGDWEGFDFLSWAALDALDIPEPEWLVPELIPVGGVTLLAGPPKSCKTFLAIAIAVTVASDSTAFDTKTTDDTPSDLGIRHLRHFRQGAVGNSSNRHGTVLYFSPDDPNRGRFRARVRMVTGGQRPENLRCTFTQTPGIGATFVDRLIETLNSTNPEPSVESVALPPVRLVVIDTLQRVKAPGSGGDRYADDVAALAQLRRVNIAHPDVSILVLHHTKKVDRKNPTDPLELVSGSQGIAAGVDHVLVLEVQSDRGPARTLHLMGRDGEDHKLALSMTGDGLVHVGEDPDDPARLMGDKLGHVYRVLREFPGGVEVAEVAKATGCTSKDASTYLRRLVEQGHAFKESWGVYRCAEWKGDAR